MLELLVVVGMDRLLVLEVDLVLVRHGFDGVLILDIAVELPRGLHQYVHRQVLGVVDIFQS